MTSCKQIAMSFFSFMANFQQSRSRILDAYSVKLIFLLTVTFYLRKTENRTKNSLTQPSHYFFEERYYIWKQILTSRKLRMP